MNPRTRTRNRLYVWGIVPSILLLVFATKVILMLAAQSAGESAYSSDRYDDARGEFAGNQTVNLIERWRAPFNEGGARFGQEDYEGAVEEFETSLDDAPAEEECTIRVNIALSHEALGDASLDEQDTLGAIESWRTGRKVLAEGGCETEDARSTDERLEEKLREENAEEEPPKKQEKKQKKPDPELEKKRKKLEKQTKQGMEKRKEYQEYDDYPYQSDQPEQHW